MPVWTASQKLTGNVFHSSCKPYSDGGGRDGGREGERDRTILVQRPMYIPFAADRNMEIGRPRPSHTQKAESHISFTAAAALLKDVFLRCGVDCEWQHRDLLRPHYRYRPESVTNGKYSGQEWTGPVWAAPEGEESITWKQFVSAMQSKDVTVVDFVGKR